MSTSSSTLYSEMLPTFDSRIWEPGHHSDTTSHDMKGKTRIEVKEAEKDFVYQPPHAQLKMANKSGTPNTRSWSDVVKDSPSSWMPVAVPPAAEVSRATTGPTWAWGTIGLDSGELEGSERDIFDETKDYGSTCWSDEGGKKLYFIILISGRLSACTKDKSGSRNIRISGNQPISPYTWRPCLLSNCRHFEYMIWGPILLS